MSDIPEKRSVAGITRKTFQKLAGRERFPQPEVIGLQHPVVLMHGFGMIALFLRGGHLHDEAMFLRQRGVRAYAPNVSPYHTVQVRAGMWKECVEQILKECGARKVHLIAHSMGGLDARYMISRLGMGERVNSLVSISTPHRGSALADIVLESPERVQDWLTDAANWAGSSAMDGLDSDFRQAVMDLTPDHVIHRFNEEVPDDPSVAYFSYAGCAGKGTRKGINPLLKPQNAMLYKREGKNDGFVAVESARWGNFLGTIDADHAQQIGINWTPQHPFVSTTFYAGVARHLKRLEEQERES